MNQFLGEENPWWRLGYIFKLFSSSRAQRYISVKKIKILFFNLH